MATSSFFSSGGSAAIDPVDFNALRDTLQTQTQQATSSATAAASSEANAAVSETNAATSATTASTAATTATTAATNASSSASAASTSATNAATSASNASSSATSASSSATNAATSATNAASSASAAATSATNAADSATQAANTLASKADLTALTAHTGNTSNPHGVTKAQVGLGNVDNTSDLAKPVSTATQTALNAKEATIAAGTTAQYWRGDKSWQTLDKAAVGLTNVDNTNDVSKPVSTAQQTALDTKANLSGASFTGAVSIGTTSSETGTLLWTHKNSAYWNYLKASNTLNSMYVGVTDVGTTRLASLGNYQIELAINGATKATLDTGGNFVLGTTPASTWAAGFAMIQMQKTMLYGDTNSAYLQTNAINTSTGLKYNAAQKALRYYQDSSNGVHSWSVAAAGTAGGALTFTEAMQLDASGNLLVGATSGSVHILSKAVSEGSDIAYMQAGSTVVAAFKAATTQGWNVANAAFYTAKNSSTSRSINVSGTVNASGADYAEYMRKAENCGAIAKGAIVGVNAQGQLTDKWADAVSFVVKSTDPSYVGGDTWGSEEALGTARPTEPQRKTAVTEQRLVSGIEGSTTAQYETVILEAGDTDEEWEAKQATYQAALQTFEDTLEAARQQVDRIAFAGQVPVNVLGATVGDYIVPVQDGAGIKGVAVAEDDMTLKQYMKAVGIVQNILPDGRANIRVKVA